MLWQRIQRSLTLVVTAAVLGLMASLPVSAAPARPCDGDQQGLLVALGLNWDNQVALMQVRGFDPTKEAAKQADGLGNWLKGLPDQAAALILMADGDRHCAYLVDRTKLVAFGVGDQSAAELKARHAAWRSAAGVDQAGDTRRGLMESDGSSAAVAMSADEALTRFGSALLPQKVIDALGGYRRVLVLPYGDLGAAPFGAIPLGSGKRFIDVSAVMVLPGVQLAKGAGGAWTNRRGYRACPPPPAKRAPALVVGDPTRSYRSPGGAMPPLPGARREAKAVSAIYGVTPLLNKQATLAAVKKQAVGVDVIHLAAHGVALPDTPLESYIALADGEWTAGEIMQSCLGGVRLAVLSACQTGLGKIVDGGVIGLARAFYLAGVDDVVMTLWSVDDEATVLLMTTFASRSKAGLGADEALRQAMIETRKTYPNPAKWAAFSVFGSSMLPERGN